MTWKLQLPKILPHERTSLVDQLIDIINQQKQQIDILIEEVKRLKGHKGKPKIRPNSLEKPNNKKKQQEKSKHRKNKKQPDRVEIIKADKVPVGARFKGYRNYEIQELIIRTEKVLYRLERWQLPDGSYVVAKLPSEIGGFHFGPILRAYILHQHHHQGVTQPLLLEQLREWGVDISNGQLNHLLIDNKEQFHTEKDGLLKAGLSVSSYIHTDDTGARHMGKNGYCTHIGNDLFAWFKSTHHKSRINFLELLKQNNKDYCLTRESFSYMQRYKVAPWIRNKLKPFRERQFDNEERWQACLNRLGIKHKHYVRLVTEAALIGSLLKHGFSKEIVILSDDAGQFNVFQHALCWIHAERIIAGLIPSGKNQVEAVEWARKQIWDVYHLLIDYKQDPNKELKQKIIKEFNVFRKTKTDYQTLNLALKRLYANKEELLLVLKRPEIPLHNNLSERDIREYVKRRKISGSTRSDDGKKCRDTFASLKKTALKLKISFWDYLVDRITNQQNIPQLPDLIIQTAINNSS
jgi:hypothetical protein